MKYFILCALVFASIKINYSQLQVSVDIYQTDFTYTDVKDSLYVTVKIKNNETKTIKFRKANGLVVSYYGGNYYDHCFRVFSENRSPKYQPDYEHTIEDFIEINPGEEFTETNLYSIGWICRGGPPRDSIWNFDLFYSREVTADDNYYLFKSRYSDKYDKEYTEAWTGKLESNKISVSFKRY